MKGLRRPVLPWLGRIDCVRAVCVLGLGPRGTSGLAGRLGRHLRRVSACQGASFPQLRGLGQGSRANLNHLQRLELNWAYSSSMAEEYPRRVIFRDPCSNNPLYSL